MQHVLGEGRGAYKGLVGKHDGNRTLAKPTRRWEDNIEMDFKEIDLEGLEQSALADVMDKQCALVNAVMNLRAP